MLINLFISMNQFDEKLTKKSMNFIKEFEKINNFPYFIIGRLIFKLLAGNYPATTQK